MARRVEHDPWEGHHVPNVPPHGFTGGGGCPTRQTRTHGWATFPFGRLTSVCPGGRTDVSEIPKGHGREGRPQLDPFSPTSSGTRPTRGPRVATPGT
eukprot:1389434-Heterocapsa_arctica.AAC.1